MDSAYGSPQPPRPLRSRRRPRRTPRRRWGTHFPVVLIQAVLGGVGGVFLTTGSVVVTVVAAVLAAVVLALVLIIQR